MFGKTTEYAIRALVYIYLQNLIGSRPGFKEIAQQINAPEAFTGKVLQVIVKSKLLASSKGRGGGFYFIDLNTPIMLIEIVSVFEDDSFFIKCGFGLSECSSNAPCPLHNAYSPIREKMRKVTINSSIQMLALRIKNNKAVLNRFMI